MSVSEKLLRAALVFCLFYTALAIRERTVGYEAFPFFAWDLYVKVPPDMTTSYSARILELDGRPIDSRPYYEEARRLVPAAKNVRAIQLLERLGRAVDTDRPESARRARKLFDQSYLDSFDQATYEVVRRSFSIRERLECQCFRSETVIATYSFDHR